MTAPHRGHDGRAEPGEEQTQVVVDLGERPDRAPRAGLARLLVDRHGRRQALDQVHVRPLELVEELAGIAREALDVPPLPLGEDRVEGQRALPRAADAREHDQAVSGQVEVDALEIVHARAADRDGLDGSKSLGGDVMVLDFPIRRGSPATSRGVRQGVPADSDVEGELRGLD